MTDAEWSPFNPFEPSQMQQKIVDVFASQLHMGGLNRMEIDDLLKRVYVLGVNSGRIFEQSQRES